MRSSLAIAGDSAEPCKNYGGLKAVNDNGKQPNDTMILLLGELKGMVSGIKEDVDELKKDITSDRLESSASRRRMYDKLDGVDQRLTKMESTVTVMGGVVDKQTQRVDAIEPVVTETQAAVRQMVIRWGLVTGALGAMGAGLYWLFTAKWQDILKILVQFLTSPS